MALNFEKFARTGNEFINQLAKELGEPENKQKAGRILRSVLHALRDRLTTNENVQLLSQLPMALKAVYVDGWTLKEKTDIRHYSEFLEEIRRQDGNAAETDFKTDDETERAINVVFLVLRKYLSLGELEDIEAALPKELKNIVKTTLMI